MLRRECTGAQIPVGQTSVFCDVHKNEEVKHFCKTCKTLVCSECVVDDRHVGHIFLRIKDIVGEAKESLQKGVLNVKSSTIPKVEKMLKEVKETLKKHYKDGTEMVNNINERANEIILETNKARSEHLQKVEMHQSTEQKKLKDFEQTLESVLLDTNELMTGCNADLGTGKDASIIKHESDLGKKVHEIERELENFPEVIHCMFVTGQNVMESVKSSFGHCVFEKKLQVISEFQHDEARDNDGIHALESTNQSAWIVTYQSVDIKQVDKTGRVNKTVTFTSHISDIAVTDDGGLFVTRNKASDGREYRIMKVKPNGKIVRFVDMKPLKPKGICISTTGQIYVGCVDSNTYEVTDENTRSVMKLSGTGIVQQRYQYDDKGQRLFTLARKIKENSNGDVWVCDRTARYEGRVVVLQQDGKLKFIYTGLNHCKIIKNFHPGDLAAAGDSTMLISDTHNHIVHLVDANGSLLHFIGSPHKTGIYKPGSISLDRMLSQLWIGNSNNYVQVLDFK